MIRYFAIAATVLALAAMAAAGSRALGQELYDPRPVYPISRTLEKITSYPSDHVVPLKHMEAPLSALARPPAPKKTVLQNEWGGRLDMHRMRFASYNASGDDIEIRGVCHSACTLVMGIIPPNRICFSARGYLSFHKASNRDGTVSIEHTKGMIDSYPTGIQKWIEAQGGITAMPHNEGRWVLAAPDLWKMGYRKCD